MHDVYLHRPQRYGYIRLLLFFNMFFYIWGPLQCIYKVQYSISAVDMLDRTTTKTMHVLYLYRISVVSVPVHRSASIEEQSHWKWTGLEQLASRAITMIDD
jgi:hypothetical protein